MQQHGPDRTRVAADTDAAKVLDVHDHELDFWSNLRNELASGAQWIDRAVVLAYAAATGLVVVGFTLLSEAVSAGFEALRQRGEISLWLQLLWTPALTVALLWWTRRFVPGAQPRCGGR